jgi:hypothetical protein
MRGQIWLLVCGKEHGLWGEGEGGESGGGEAGKRKKERGME